VTQYLQPRKMSLITDQDLNIFQLFLVAPGASSMSTSVAFSWKHFRPENSRAQN
jgi:hypothetical protein